MQTLWHRSRCFKFDPSQLFKSLGIKNQQPYTICLICTPNHRRQDNSIVLKLVRIYTNPVIYFFNHLAVGTRYKNWFTWITILFAPGS
jgi:hypothetical protein